MLSLLLSAAVSLAFEEPDFELTTRYADDPADYFDGLHRDQLLDLVGGNSALDDMDYEVGDFQAAIIVPDEYEAGAGWGVYVHIAASGGGGPRDDWREVLVEHKLIYIGPHGVGNGTDSAVRIGVALDSLATVEDGWDIDPDRRIIGGFSGGAAIATMIGAHYPDVFHGTVDMCRAIMWEEHEISTMPGSAFGDGEVNHLDDKGLKSIQNGHRFAFVSGDEDILPVGDQQFSNYEGILKGMGDWWDRDIRTRLWDVPGLKHEKAPGDAFSAALDWVLTCADDGSYPARFDSDHAPPLTPVETPEASAPEPCDPGDPWDPSADPDSLTEEDEKGCGCESTGGPMWLFVPLMLLLRRQGARPIRR